MTVPYLAGVIAAKDIKEKGTGFKAKYMAWAKVAQLFNEHCKGWTFHLRPSEQGHLLWTAPNGAYLLCYFKDPSGKEYSDFPYAIMDNRNNAIPVDRITARDISDSARRALPAACAMQFSLGFELWAQEEIEANQPPQRDPDRWKKIPSPVPPANTPAIGKQDIPKPVSPEDRQAIISDLMSMHQVSQGRFRKFDSEYRAAFPDCEKGQLLSEHIQTQEQADFVIAWFVRNGAPEQKE